MSVRPTVAVVSFDVYSALVDSRRGLTAAFAALAGRRGWRPDPHALAQDWDQRNKAAQRDCLQFRPYRELARTATASLEADLGLAGDPDADTDFLLGTIGDWPTWPDVAEGVAAVAAVAAVALLSNIDDDLLAATRLGARFDAAVTSAQARAYKPRRALYDHARRLLGPTLVHVPASARDTRGALEAGLPVVRVRRPGHHVDPDGPQPAVEVDDLRAVPDALSRAASYR
ncbi:MAG: haloacid dehalogenase [Egibacteraceae bacterium]